MPTEANRERFQEYDPSREGVLHEDYAQSVGAAQDVGQAGLGQLGQATQQMGKGFSGAGMRGAAMEQGRESLMGDFLRQQAAAKSTLFKGVRSEREQYMTDIGKQLSALQEAEGTLDYNALGSGTTSSGGLQNFNTVPTSNMGDMINVNDSPYHWDFDTNSYVQGYK